MITPTDKREASLSILQRLRRQGLPTREEKVEGMFDGLLAQSDEDRDEGRGETTEPEYEYSSPEEEERERAKKKKKGPNLDQGKVGQFKKGFLSTP